MCWLFVGQLLNSACLLVLASSSVERIRRLCMLCCHDRGIIVCPVSLFEEK